MKRLSDDLYKKAIKNMSLATADGAVIKDKKILLTKRAIEPFKNCWVLPGGHVERNESASETALREVFEETGLVCKAIEYLGVYSSLRRDPRYHTVSNIFLLDAVSGSLRKTSEVSESAFFAKNELPKNIGFDHRQIIGDVFSFLKSRKSPFFDSVVKTKKKREWLSDDDFEKIIEVLTLAGSDGLVVNNDKILLTRRSIEPFKNSWTIPGGFTDSNETAEACAVREVSEETGLETEVTGHLGVYNTHDPRCHVIVNVFFLKITGGKLRISKESGDAAFFGEDELPENIGFNHRTIVNDAFKILREKKIIKK